MKTLTLADGTIIEYKVEEKPVTRSHIAIYLQGLQVNENPIICETGPDENHEEKIESYVTQAISTWVPLLGKKLADMKPKMNPVPKKKRRK